ncbi:MAG: GTP-binding protein [Xanthobacteraceae bacterium]|nr:GTP-binding protein [Xanthobacteraceae bacterium]
MSHDQTIPVTVLTGFLGSGKTTVLNHVLTSSELADTAVIINEFGEVGLDHLLVSGSTETLIVLDNGCLCCTVRGDLIETFADLEGRIARGEIAPFRRVVIETTGLADPAPVLHTLMADPAVTQRWHLAGVITTVDAVNGARTLAAHREALKQAAVADRILLTKCDIASSDELAAIRALLRTLNPGIPVADVIEGRVDPSAILDVGLRPVQQRAGDIARWLTEEPVRAGHAHHDHHHHDASRHDHRIKTHSIIVDEPVSWGAFSYWLELLAALRGEEMLRVKGIVAVSDHPERPMVIHGVQHIFHPPVQLEAWPSGDRRTRIVFITRDMDTDDLERTLRRFAKVGAAAGAPAMAV